MGETETHVIARGNTLEYWHLPANDAETELMILRPYKEKTAVDLRIEREEAARQAGTTAIKASQRVSLAPLPESTL